MNISQEVFMLKKYLIERNIPNVGQSSEEDFQNMVSTSKEILQILGSDIKWGESYVTDNKLYCVYEAANEDLIRRHAELGGFPADKISEIKETLSPDSNQNFAFKPEHRPNVDMNLS